MDCGTTLLQKFKISIFMSESDLQLSHLLHILFKNFVLSDEDFIFKLIIMFYFSLELF